MYASQADGRAYIVGYTDSPNFTGGMPVDAVLDAVRDSALESSAFKLLSESPVTVDGHPGRDIRMQNPAGYTMRLKLALAGSRMYQVAVATRNEDAAAPEIDAYLQSFHVTGR